MKPNNPHSNRVFSLLYQFGKDNIFSWNMTHWNPFSENVVSFCVDKPKFRGTISIQESSINNLFFVAFQDCKWKTHAMTVIEGEKLAEFVTLLGAEEKKWSAGVSRNQQAQGERAPVNEPVACRSAQ